ncbi:hypothetical protein GCM10009737_07990 [Nocardioides lentus]|uniref:MarR family transcriptional regulator n=1 Tax=Nocardioides lentus TaxID=338077 RepID=A0ABP5AC30_9ACTN
MQVTARLVRLAAGAVVNNQAGSVHTIARVVDVDHVTAAALMHELEAAGIVGPAKVPAGRLRDVRLTPDELTRERLDALAVTGLDA